MANYVLEILDGDRAGEVLSVPDRAMRIGRKPNNDVVLADEKTSGVHAEVVLEGDRHVLRDLGSTNGTFLDGKRVTEVVLTVGDVVTVGRLRVKFREEGDAPAAAGEGEFAVHRLDARRVQKRGSSMLLLGLLVLVGAGVGGYFWWSNRTPDEGTGRTGGTVAKRKDAMVVPGNKLGQAVAACEDDTAWNLAAHGIGWQPSGSANSGKGALEAVRIADDATDFAIAMPSESLAVFSGRSITIAAFVRTEGDAQVAVRALFSKNAEGDGSALRFRTGSKLQSSSQWQQVTFEVGVPPGCDRLDVELVAVLPSAEAVAQVDDVAVTEAGSGKPLDHRMDEGGQTVVGSGSAFAVHSTDTTLLGIVPGTVPVALQQLHLADLCVLSDVGGELVAVPEAGQVKIAVSGANDLQLVFPADSAGGTVAREGDGPFAAVAAQSEYRASEILLGQQLTRVLVRTESPVACAGRLGGGLYRLRVETANVDLVFNFNAERQQALALAREAKAKDAAKEPGRALDLLHQLQEQAPHDSVVLDEAVSDRATIFARLDDAISGLQREYGEAEFFNTRGGFERVVRGVDQLIALYGENNMTERAAAVQLRDQAMAELTELDSKKEAALRERFAALATAFTEAEQPGLAKLVQDYVQRNLGGN